MAARRANSLIQVAVRECCSWSRALFTTGAHASGRRSKLNVPVSALDEVSGLQWWNARFFWTSAAANARHGSTLRLRRRPAARPGARPSYGITQADSWRQAFMLPDVILNRQIEFGDLLFGFEQERQMSLQTPNGTVLLAVAEEPGHLFLGTILRQIFESSRAFTFLIFTLDDASQPNVIYRIKRDFPWFNLMGWVFREVTVEDSTGNVVASATRNWHPLYRNYDLYYAKEVGEGDDVELTMFSKIEVPFWRAMLTWVYPMTDSDRANHATIERIFGNGIQGAAEQIFTEKGNYLLAVRDPSIGVHQRLAMVACAISIDFDFYSRRVGGGGWLFPYIGIWGSGDDY